MKRIVNEEQSQREILAAYQICPAMVEGSCAQVVEPASEPRAIEVRRFSGVNGVKREYFVQYRILIRVVPPKLFGPL